MRLGANVPAILAHPDWSTPVPCVLWMHGRTVSKELDPGRYLRWIRHGIAAIAVDLPGHGERFDPELQKPARTLDVTMQMRDEIDGIVESLADPALGGLFDLDRMAIGGMSAGGMVTLRRLCDPHPFAAAAVEGTTGRLTDLYFPEDSGRTPWGVSHDRAKVAAMDASLHLEGFRPLPLLVLHSEADEVVPWSGQARFVRDVRARCARAGASPDLVQVRTWTRTGAPQEHSGFGEASNDAKNTQVAFLTRVLRAAGERDGGIPGV